QLLIPLPPTTDGRDKKSCGKSYNIMTEENLNRLLYYISDWRTFDGCIILLFVFLLIKLKKSLF
ncbi:hypothetical protein, partial [Bacteroides acidifaciens]|uniref:hypothetical protein n=1 Tax=Bacteroides acidifaciens TaxID=85831 RepID=UPI002557FAE1